MACWKERNEIEHGKAQVEDLVQRKMVLHKRMRELYKRKRTKLTLDERKLFALPQHMRKKTSAEAIEIWIQRAEATFSKYREKVQVKVDTWLTERTPIKSWRERLRKDNEDSSDSSKQDK